MTTNSYLEFFLTLLGWIINNGIWNLLIATGLFALPLVLKVVGIWLKVREEGDDEGNKGKLSLPRIENALYSAFFVMSVYCLPIINVSLDSIQYDKSRSKSCGTWTPKAPDESGYSTIISSMDGQTAAAPIWWVLMHKLSKGITQAAMVTIPCRPDLRQLRFEVQHTRISNPALAAELQDYTNDCYALALCLWKQQDQEQTKEEDALCDVEWLGSSTFLNGSDYYDQLQSKTPRASFPWNESRDSGRPDTGRGSYPTCREWWSSADTGLEARVVAQASPGMWLRMSAALKMMGKDNTEYKESIVRRLVSPESSTVSQNGRTYAGYGGNADFTLDNSASRIGGIAGMSLGSLAAFPAFDAMRQALPMVQALLLMALYVMLPLILAFGSYEFKTVITVSFVVFALNFLTFWWELARWLDSWLMEALYSSDTHIRWNAVGFKNSSDDLIMNFVMGAMFIVLPALWMAAFGWAGLRVGGMAEMFSNGAKNVQEAAGKAGGTVSGAIKK